jgi:hypothetical protein
MAAPTAAKKTVDGSGDSDQERRPQRCDSRHIAQHDYAGGPNHEDQKEPSGEAWLTEEQGRVKENRDCRANQ